MRKQIFTIVSVFAIATSSFAIGKADFKSNVIKEVILLPLHCRTVSASDTEGNVLASGSCCANMSSTATTADYVAANLQLDACASKKLEKALAGN